jgi:nucleotide-binding universal stress UspA family protein
MPQLNEILFPVDLSERCGRTASAVKALTKRLGARLTLLNVPDIASVPQISYPVQRYADLRKKIRDASWNAVDRFLKRHFGSFSLRCVIKEGDPAQVIVDYAHKHKVDLIMMPTHGYGPFRRFLTGSVTAKVLHDARCPVWTSAHVERSASRVTREYRNILCAVECNSAAMPLIRWASWLARCYQATLKIVHVIPALDETSRNRGEVELRRYLTRRTQTEFAVLMDQAGVQSQLIIRGGNIPARLAETARQQRADLIVIGRGHARKALGRVRTHSLAIVRESPCPVLSI